METQIVTVTTKGQIAIPVSIRKKMAIETGDKLVAYTNGEVLMLKVIKLPDVNDFLKSLDEAQQWAEAVGFKESDVNKIIKSVRKNK